MSLSPGYEGLDLHAHIDEATGWMEGWLDGKTFDVVTLNKVEDEAALDFAENLSQLSSLISLEIEADAINRLNQRFKNELPDGVRWARNDRIHGEKYPDLALADMSAAGSEDASDRVWPGIEIKAWCPFATEITGRMKKGQSIMQQSPSTMILAVWLPEHLLYGQPKIFTTWVGDGLEMAKSRDQYWHNPPSSVIVEPDYSPDRAAHKQHTNVTRYLLDDDSQQADARAKADELGILDRPYSYDSDYQQGVRTLINTFDYKKGSNNFRKLNRLHHPPLDQFRDSVRTANSVEGKTFKDWYSHLKAGEEAPFIDVLNGGGQSSLGNLD